MEYTTKSTRVSKWTRVLSRWVPDAEFNRQSSVWTYFCATANKQCWWVQSSGAALLWDSVWRLVTLNYSAIRNSGASITNRTLPKIWFFIQLHSNIKSCIIHNAKTMWWQTSGKWLSRCHETLVTFPSTIPLYFALNYFYLP